MTLAVKSILQNYLRRLTNLSGNNRSLLLLRLHAEQLIDVHDFGFLSGERAFGVIKALIAGLDKKLCPVLDSRLEASNEISKRLKKLQRMDRFIFEERGSNDLHVGWPFVHGKFSDGTPVRCPLLYFPVSLVQKNQHWELHLRQDAGITFNKSFLLAYSFYNRIKLDESLLDFSFEDFDRDSLIFRTQLYELLKDQLELNFNRENFKDDIIAFNAYRKTQFDEANRNGELKLYPEAVLGIFPQASSQLVPDYLKLIETEAINELEAFFEQKNISDNESVNPHAVQEEKLLTPFAIDAYQENAIRMVKLGKSIVVQGPPGTGKSQLICNLMADAMASGKKALLVCQKRAALDVVYERMQALELADFIGLVHDFRNDRKTIYAKIARQVELLDEYKEKNRGIDVIQAERKFLQVSRRIDQIAEELEEFRSALYNDSECGVSAKELYLTSTPHARAISLKQEYQHFTFSTLPEFIRTLRLYARYAETFEAPTYLWLERKSFSGFQAGDEQLIEKTIREILAYQKKVSTEIFKRLGVGMNLEDCESFLGREAEIQEMVLALEDDEVYRYFQHMVGEPDEATSLLWVSNVQRVVMNCFDEEGPEVTASTEMLGKYQEALHERVQARGNVVRWIRWELFSKNKFLIKRLLVANDLAYNKYGLRVLEQRIDCRLNLEHHLTAVKKASWLLQLPQSYNKEVLREWFERQKLAVKAKLIFHNLREIKDTVNVQQFTRKEFIALLQDLLALVKYVPDKKREWQQYLSRYHIRQIILSPDTVEALIAVLRNDFDSLCDFDRIKDNLKEHEREVIQKLHDHLQSWNAAEIESLFQNSLRLTWLDHLETKYPNLRAVSTLKMNELEKELQLLVAEKQQLSETILNVRTREVAYEGVQYNRLQNRVTYRDLHHQVTKKKKIWPLRKVIAEHHHELFQLLPCWMASPESVSAIFPMEPLFDMVIFDEASQCFAERGIPAMFRGKQVVIAGDDQQLRPSELYQVRWEEESDDPNLEVESLLELSERYLSTVHLQGHYRSKALELIQFSNHYFYENRLQLLPDRHVLNQNEAAIEYRKVDGQWENQTNAVEASAVVKLVIGLWKEFPQKEIGVVTFNAPQQLLILDLLEAEALQENVKIPSTFFVKNIENVQGDEKDIIIFSVGYAPDKVGKMAMQFGSLNTAGGENRLNVAVTRAREKIIVVTSIWPEQLKTDDLKNTGPLLLRKYLEYARQVQEQVTVAPTLPPARHSGDWYLSHHIQRWGNKRLHSFTFETNHLPCADVTVLMENRHLGIILTDDERYYRALSVKEAHAYVPALLAKKNWKHHKVYSRQYWKDFEKLERDLMVFVGNQQ